MIYTIFAVKDRSVDAYQPTQCARSEMEAIRSFGDAIQNPASHVMHKHPDDFDLYQVGTFDDNTGKITPTDPRKIADGKSLAQGEI